MLSERAILSNPTCKYGVDTQYDTRGVPEARALKQKKENIIPLNIWHKRFPNASATLSERAILSNPTCKCGVDTQHDTNGVPEARALN